MSPRRSGGEVSSPPDYETDDALDDAKVGLALAREAQSPQTLYGTLATQARSTTKLRSVGATRYVREGEALVAAAS
jgi:hypothetical protein